MFVQKSEPGSLLRCVANAWLSFLLWVLIASCVVSGAAAIVAVTVLSWFERFGGNWRIGLVLDVFIIFYTTTIAAYEMTKTKGVGS